MDINAGNALSAVPVMEKEKTGKSVEVDLEKAEVDGSTPQTPVTDGGDMPLEPVFSRVKELTISRARLVALVVTLTGAAFLNVSIPSIFGIFKSDASSVVNAKNRHWATKPLLSSFRV